MNNNQTKTVFWQDGALCLVDQNALPYAYNILRLETAEAICEQIATMGVRGAPALGVAGAFAVALAAKRAPFEDMPSVMEYLEKESKVIATVRPTATKLALAVSIVMERARKVAKTCGTKEALFAELRDAAQGFSDSEEDNAIRFVEIGADLLSDGMNVITHCSTGPLCTISHGSAAGAVIRAHQQGKRVHVYVDETRPRLQGAKLNVYDFQRENVPFTLITDNMAGYVMKEGLVDIVMVGSDKVAANGDTAAKIGVYGLSVLAKAHNIPVYMCAALSSVDFSIESGDEIVIEQRDPEEVRVINGCRIVPEDTPVLNPAFDVTPAEYFTGIITEEGIAYPPYKDSLSAFLRKKQERLAKGN